MQLIKIILAASISLLLAACSDKDTALQESLNGNAVDTISNLNYGTSTIPFPNDLLFAPTPGGPASDGTLNIPVDDANDLSDPKVAMNGLDGFSTVAPISTGFSAAIDSSSISATSVRMYSVPKAGGPGGPVTGAGTALTYGVDYIPQLSSLDSSNATLVIVPLKPLSPKSSYAVVLTNELKSTSGRAVGISGSYLLTRGAAIIYDTTATPVPPSLITATAAELRAAIKVGSLVPPADATDLEIEAAAQSAYKLESIRAGIVKPSEDALVAGDSSLNSADIILHWSFTTQSTSDVLAQVRTDIRGAAAPPVTAINSVAETTLPPPFVLTKANIHIGTINVPYYINAASGINDPTPLGSFWKGVGGSLLTYLGPNLSPVATSTETIPMLLSIPKVGNGETCGTAKPATGWPVVIYQHGITTNRATMLALADAMASACMAVVAIDMPMHGLTDSSNPFYQRGPAGAGSVTERTFDLDLVTQDPTTGDIVAAAPDGVTDTSGRHFINLSNLQNTRDNLRQGTSDLFALTYALTTMSYDGVSDSDFDVTKIYFLGHSLGAMVGTSFAALEPNIKATVLSFAGSQLAKILDGSATFGPSIAAGLAASGVVKGTADYESFLGAAQTVIDSADPLNHIGGAISGRGVLFFEIVGGNGSPSDLVVPNTVPDANDASGTVPAPLAGSSPLISLMGLTQVNSSQGPSSNLQLVSRFVSGGHGSLLDPTADVAVTIELQTEAASFLASNGAVLTVNDSTVLQAPPAP